MSSETIIALADLETTCGKYLPDVNVKFRITREMIQREPYSDGWSRGSYVECTATIEAAWLGNKLLFRADLVEMCGEDHIAAVEESKADELADQHNGRI